MPIDRRPIEDALGTFTAHALDLNRTPRGPAPPEPRLWVARAGLPASLPVADSAGVAAAGLAARELGIARFEWAQTMRRFDDEISRIDRASKYFEAGWRATDETTHAIAEAYPISRS